MKTRIKKNNQIDQKLNINVNYFKIINYNKKVKFIKIF